MKARAVAPVVALLAALGACTLPEPDGSAGAGLYADYCAACHGADATGGAPVEGRVPPDLTTLARRHDGNFPSVYVMSTIDGYAREQTHGPMPPFGALLDSPTELWAGPDGQPTPTPQALVQLNDYLLSLQKS